MRDVIDVEAREVPDFARAFDHEAPPAPTSNVPDAGRFIAGSHGDASGRRDFKLYIPPGAGERPLPLVVMLHGCTQNPDDFAAGLALDHTAAAQRCFLPLRR